MEEFTVCTYQESSDIREVTREIAVQSDWLVYICESIQEMKYALSAKSIQAVILEMVNTENELRILQELSMEYPRLYTIVMTNTPSVTEGVGALKFGALDYLSCDSLGSNLPKIFQGIRNKIRTRGQFTGSPLNTFQESVGLIGTSAIFHRVLQKAATAALQQETVMISGETGTGKGLLAKAIHANSRRADGPFIKVNCCAIPQPLLESELFGHLKGAYTGAVSTQDGFFQAARGGTLFLDEIGNTSLAMQAKLLQVLEEKEVWKVGSRRPDRVDVRIIAASNTPFNQLVEEGAFRKDLYYRLNVLSLRIPPLRDRHQDILPLCYYFAQRYAQEHHIEPPILRDDVLAHLQTYDWPGNVRELEHLVTELLIYAPSGEITLDLLPARLRCPDKGKKQKPLILEAMVRDHIHSICTHTNWNITQAASLLGLTRPALYRKLRRYHLGEY